MKRFAMIGGMVLFSFLVNAQQFRKGETVEVDVNRSSDGNIKWLMARVIDINVESHEYVVKASDRQLYNIPFAKEESWIRRPKEKPNKLMLVANDSLHNCYATIDLVKQKIREDLSEEYSDHDSITITYNSIDQLESYKNIDDDFGLMGSMVYPFKVDMMVRLVTISNDGVQKTVNAQVKKKYLIYQNTKGICDMAVGDRDEKKLMSKM
jgi:hypothetical protein